ncbi:MAG: hypothetical protein AVDCRST_MAG38-363, partial [uncultured Solirubrobacteraceae bacterium]
AARPARFAARPAGPRPRRHRRGLVRRRPRRPAPGGRGGDRRPAGAGLRRGGAPGAGTRRDAAAPDGALPDRAR